MALEGRSGLRPAINKISNVEYRLDAAKRTRERVQELAARTGVDLDVVRAGPYLHPEQQDLDLLGLERELELLRTIEDELRILETLDICP